MKRPASILVFSLAAALAGCSRPEEPPPSQEPPMNADAAADPHLWLEDIAGAEALAWVRRQNAASQAEIEALPEFEPIRAKILEILDSKERIPFVSKHGSWFYNFWRDDRHVRGVWRRTTLSEYRKEEPRWETVLDLDELAKAEKENWVWHGAQVLEPDRDRCLVSLSRGGADASVIREFDIEKRAFVAGGFALPEAKSWVNWRTRDEVYVGTDFGPGSLTKSGYTRMAKAWKRGTPLESATTVFEGTVEDISVRVWVDRGQGKRWELARRGVTFFTTEAFLRRGDEFVKVEKPADAELEMWGDFFLLRLKTDGEIGGRKWRAGTLLAARVEEWMSGSRAVEALFEPSDRKSLQGISGTRNTLILNELENVRSRPEILRHEAGKWTRSAVESPFGLTEAYGVDADDNDDYFLQATDFLTPSTLFLANADRPGREKLKELPRFFDAGGLEIRQFEATSKDGTRVPYFQVARKDLELSGKNPTILYGYGGFEIPMLPAYSGGLGNAWLTRGGVYVLANIRGGGEFGPAWHNAARKQNRQRAYDDFIAIAEDLVARKVTSPRHLGIKGRSNGGLLVGVMLTQRPDLWGAVVCGAPLLDMRRYNKLSAGISWVDEYGDPDRPEEWDFIRTFSPYQLVSKSADYPRVLFQTSTRDDRVHPAHARKMVARMQEQGHDVLYYENIEGGHGGSADNRQAAFMEAMAYAFLWRELRS